MSKTKTSHITFIAAPFFFAAMLVGGCTAAVGTPESDETSLDDGSADNAESTGVAESAVTASGGGGAVNPAPCGYFCPTWAKVLSDCLIIPCEGSPPVNHQ